ncbi:gluconeogenesis factor YvcK family protein [Serinibacter salmoneus]|uniref:Putative gluconeogenesis factor n=1 Tax=Serinibacter salmoneus TaxID=556530 RepID=A0A2A9D1K0_9MICO|nr:uridine diphosphate-N-acetylglucosamine-binding protein YvcK [Serinibacter salmoneus]PFG19729.1 putative cofD-like protein [Serinibacter salmoneus]
MRALDPLRIEPSRIVALGGGHGLAASLLALRHLTPDLTAVVTVADDGGSSGRLRHEMGILPPGDLRMALAALCDDTPQGRAWHDLLQHRFATDGPLDGHALGNLMLAGAWAERGDVVEGLTRLALLMGVRGRVLPMAEEPLVIEADVHREGYPDRVVRGQSRVAVTTGRVAQVRLLPEEPRMCGATLEAIRAADWVVLGPGSWYTSVLPHLQVAPLREAIHTASHLALTLNLQQQEGETDGFTAADHVRVLAEVDPDLRPDVVLADPAWVDDVSDLEDVTRSLGARLLLRQVRADDGTARHDPLRLAAAYRDAFTATWGDVTDR